jgi:hypothetical protein
MNTIQQLEDLKEWSQDSTRYERRLNFRGAGLVQPGPGRQGYQGVKPGPKPSSKRVQAIDDVVKEFNTMVMKDFNKGNLSKTPEFYTFLKKNYPKKLSSLYQSLNLIETQPLYTPDLRRNLMDKLIQEANAGEKFVEFGDLYAKVGESKSVQVSRWRKYVDKLDTRADKVSKVFDSIVNNNEALIATKEYPKGSSLSQSSLLKKAIAERAGVDSAETLMKGLNKNKFFKKNKDIIEYAFSYGFRGIPEGTTFNEIFEEGVRRKGGGVNWTRNTKQLIPDASNTVLEYARRHWNQNNLWGDKSQIKFFNKKGEPIVWKSGMKINPDQVSFTYGKSPKKWNLGTLRKGGKESGLFDEVYKTHQAYYTMMKTPVTNPKYPKGKKIPFGQLMQRTYRKGFDNWSLSPMAIDHEFGVKNKPFTNLRLASARTNAALRDIYKHVPQKGLQRKLVNELMSSVKGLKGKQLVEGLMTEGQQLAKQVLTEGYKSPHSAYTELGGKFLKPSKFKTLTAPEQKVVQRMAKADTSALFKSYQKAKIGGHCKAYGGRVGFEEAGAVNMSKCMTKAIEDNRKAMSSTDDSVRAAAIFKNRQAVDNAKKIPQIAKLIRMGIQRGKGTVGWLLGGWNIPIEAIVEGGIYEYYRREGYTHDQAFAETFTPRLLTEGAEARSTEKVPWYGGAEQLLEDDLIDLKGTQPHTETLYNMAAKEQIDNLAALGEVTSEYNKTKSHLTAIQSGRKAVDPETVERLQIRLKELEAEGIRLDRLTKEGTSGSEALRTAQEKLDTEQGQRAIEYGEYGGGDTEALAKKRERVRQREMEDKFPGYGKAQIDQMLEGAGLYIDPNLRGYKGQTVQRPQGLKFLQGIDYDYASDYYKDQDKMAYFAENFRTEKAGGGIAGLSGGKRFGPPPESGPMPQGGGLSSQFNRVKKLTG